MRGWRWVALLVGLQWGILGSEVSAQSYSTVSVFGDSLSDTGNTSATTFGISPGADYYMGRYSNGPIYSEDLATQVSGSLTTLAYGGAQTGPGVSTYTEGFFTINIPNLGKQIADFIATGPSLSSDDLMVLWGGTTDYTNGGETTTAPADHVAQGVSDLYDAGAREFLVANLPDLGRIPLSLGPGDVPDPTLTSYTVAFNNKLESELLSLSVTLPGIQVHYFDAFSAFNAILDDPTAYGFTNVTDSALSAIAADPTVDPSDYLFWDESHPTAEGHLLVSQAAYLALGSTIPEPSAAMFLILGSSLIFRRRR